jgi:hypothetical protein
MVANIQAAQAREGIETTPEQAERAYYVVTEGERAAFFDLGRPKASVEGPTPQCELFIQALADRVERVRFDVFRQDFGSIEGSPLAYDRVGLVAHIFRDFTPIEPAWAIVRQGKATADDARWLRQWWEIAGRKGWVPFAKGGEFSRFYYDVDLVLDWKEAHRSELRASGNGLPSLEHYFKPGLTWPRAGGHFSVRWLPEGCIFADKGCAVLPNDPAAVAFLGGVLNSAAAEYLLKGLVSRESMGARWEVGVIRRLPMPDPSPTQQAQIGSCAEAIHDFKMSWDEGNETSTRFRAPWLLRNDLNLDATSQVPVRLDALARYETAGEARIQSLYAELNDEVYNFYRIPGSTRAIIEETLGERPPEVLWAQMAGKGSDQKRMEHVFRLLSYVVKTVITADEDGIVPFWSIEGDPDLIARVHLELAALFPDRDVGLVEAEIANELRKNVGGYRRTAGIGEWLRNAFFEFHRSLYKNTPVIWHLASSRGAASCAFGALVDYHRFDRNRMAKLRSRYLREAIENFRREAALADKAGNTEARLEWQTRLEEAVDFDRRLQWVEEGHHEGREGGHHDFRILAPWKPTKDRPKGWDPDLDDGVHVNIAPLYKAAVLRLDG